MHGRSRSGFTMLGPTAKWYSTRSSFVAPVAGKYTRSGEIRTVRAPTWTSVAEALATGATGAAPYTEPPATSTLMPVR